MEAPVNCAAKLSMIFQVCKSLAKIVEINFGIRGYILCFRIMVRKLRIILSPSSVIMLSG